MTEPNTTPHQVLQEKAAEVGSAIQQVRESRPETHRDWIDITSDAVNRLEKLVVELIVAADLLISGGEFLGGKLHQPPPPPPAEMHEMQQRERQQVTPVPYKKPTEDPPDKEFLEYIKSWSTRFSKLKIYSLEAVTHPLIEIPVSTISTITFEGTHAGLEEAGGPIRMGELDELDARVKTLLPLAPPKQG
jgi:hypothetical protein